MKNFFIKVCEILKLIIDPNNELYEEILKIFKDSFLEIFGRNISENKNFYFIQQFIEILITLLNNGNSNNVHEFINEKNIIEKLLIFSNKKFNALSLVKFIKAILLKSEIKLLQKIHKEFETIFYIYKINKKKDNLIKSVFLEIFEIIFKENLEILSKLIVLIF